MKPTCASTSHRHGTRPTLLAMALLVGLSLGGCDLLEPSEEDSGFAPSSITGKTMEFAGLTLVFSVSNVRDPEGTNVPYSYTKTGDITASMTVRNSEVYVRLPDAEYSLSFTSASGGEITHQGATTTFTLR